jgi:type VI secretion system protein VasJ
MDALSDYAAALRSLTPHAATAWRLNRVAAWARLDCLPSHESGKTHLRAPLSQQVSILQQLNSQQANHELLAFTEVQLGNHPFWLDLNHAAAQALSRLGEDYQPARAEVELATVQLCQRLPGIDSLLFADGMACANPETRAWLQQLATNHGCSVMPSLQALTLPDNATQPATSTSPSARRDQLLAMLQQCRSMLAQRPQPVVLAGFMQAIMAEIDRFSLESWEPKLAIQALGVAYAAAQRMENTERASSLLARILLLDPEEAARLHG